MRRHIFALLITFFVSAIAQAQELQGIGDFRIGMSEAKFLDLPQIKSLVIDDAANQESISDDSKMWRQDNKSQTPSIHSDISEVWKIHLPEYTIYNFKTTTGVKRKSSGEDSYIATAEFYKGELIKISVNSGESAAAFIDLLSAKYGKPKKTGQMKTAICLDGSRSVSQHDSGVQFLRWFGKAPIVGHLMVVYGKCGEVIESSYGVINEKKSHQLMLLELAAKDKVEKKELKSRAAGSKL